MLGNIRMGIEIMMHRNAASWVSEQWFFCFCYRISMVK